MRVLYFGTYERDYPRNRQVISALRLAGVQVDERHEPVSEGEEHKWNAGPATLLRLVRAQSRLLRRRPRERYDAVIVGYPGHFDLVAARRAAQGAPVIFNPLVSLWETFVRDRGRFSPGSLSGRVLLAIDRQALRAADLVVADTDANSAFLAELGALTRERVASCFVGAEERLFHPGWRPTDAPLFVGKLIPLHGLETILEAARLVPDQPISVVGSGQLESLMETRPPNVQWRRWLPYELLPDAYRNAACALGIFGTGGKPRRVIPNKAFQALACGTPLVTADTPAARELLRNGESALLVPPGDPESLAAAIERLVGEPAYAARIAENGHEQYLRLASEQVLGVRWRQLLEAAIERRR